MPGIFMVVGLYHFYNSYKESYIYPYSHKEAVVQSKFSFIEAGLFRSVRILHVEKPGRTPQHYHGFDAILPELDSLERKTIFDFAQAKRDSVENSLRYFTYGDTSLLRLRQTLNDEDFQSHFLKLDSFSTYELRLTPFYFKGHGIRTSVGDSLWEFMHLEEDEIEDLEEGDAISIYFRQGRWYNGQGLAEAEAIDPWFSPWARDSEHIAGMWIFGIIAGFSAFVTFFNLARGGQPGPWEEGEA